MSTLKLNGFKFELAINKMTHNNKRIKRKKSMGKKFDSQIKKKQQSYSSSESLTEQEQPTQQMRIVLQSTVQDGTGNAKDLPLNQTNVEQA